MGTKSFREFTPELWPDFARFFESKGCPSYCWCMAWRPLPGRSYCPVIAWFDYRDSEVGEGKLGKAERVLQANGV